MIFFFFFQAEDGIRDKLVTGVQTCALPISADRTDLGAELAEAEKTERLALEAGADRRLPLALAHPAVLARDAAGEGEDEAPGELGRRIGQHVGAAYGDAARLRRRQVDRGVAHAGGDQQLEIGQALEERGGEG